MNGHQIHQISIHLTITYGCNAACISQK